MFGLTLKLTLNAFVFDPSFARLLTKNIPMLTTEVNQ